MEIALVDAKGKSQQEIKKYLTADTSMTSFVLFNLSNADFQYIEKLNEGGLNLNFVKVSSDHKIKSGKVYLISPGLQFVINGTSITIDQNHVDNRKVDLRVSEDEAKHRYLIEKSRELICTHEPNGKYKYVSPSVKILTGYDSDELIGKNPYDFFHPEDIEHIRIDSHDPTIKGEAPKNIQYRFRKKDGSYIWFDTYTELIEDDNGNIQSLLTGSRDVTDLKNTELQLKESDQRFRGIADNIPGVVYLCNNDETYSMIYLNKEVKDMTGYEKSDFLEGKVSFVDLYHPDDKEEIFQTVDRALGAKKPFHLTYRIQKKNSEKWVWVDEYGQGVFDGDKLRMIEGVILDSTERRVAENKLREREANLKAIFESTNSIIGLFDTQKRLIEFNSSFEAYAKNIDGFELHRGMDLIGTLEKIRPELAKVFRAEQDRALGGEKFKVTQEYPSPQGTFYFSAAYNPIYQDGEVIGTSLFIEDITELRESQKALERYTKNLEQLVKERTKELEEKNRKLLEGNLELEKALKDLKSTQAQLIQAEKMASLGVLAAGIGHEINNPLNFIQNGCNGLMHELKHQNGYQQNNLKPFFDIINDGVRRASEIVKSLGHFSRQVKSMDEECRLHTVIDNCLVMLSGRIKHRVEVKKNYAQEDVIIIGNEGKLHQVILNLLSNAEQAIEKEGSISISTKKTKENKVIVEIQDDGMGIPQEHIDKISDPFFTTKEPGEGTGLGLFIVYSIMKEFNGSVRVSSEQQKGTTFALHFFSGKHNG